MSRNAGTSGPPGSRVSTWVSVLFVLGVLLGLELGLFIVINQFFHKTAGELAGPYLAFAALPMIIWALAWWLRKWEEHGAMPRWLALGWGLLIALLFSGVAAALFYSGVRLHFFNSKDLVDFVVVEAISALVFALVMYRVALKRLSARAPRNAQSGVSN